MKKLVITERENIASIADAVRNRIGKTDGLTLGDIIDDINYNIGKVELPELSNEGSSFDLLSGKQLIDQDGNIVEGTIPTKTVNDLTAIGASVNVPAGYYANQATKFVSIITQAVPTIDIDSNGLVTATATQSSGYVNAGTKTATKQLEIQDAKTVTPTKSSQTVVASGVYATGDIVVEAIPDKYIDTSDGTATSEDIVFGEAAYVNGIKIVGTMPNNGSVSKSLDANTTSYTIPKGLHDGSGKVSITTETKSVTPTKEVQTVVPTNGKVLSSVSVSAIPDEYQDVSSVTANASDVLSGKKIVDSDGNVVNGSIETRVASDLAVNGATVTVPSGYYDSSVSKNIATVTRANTTISTTVDDINDKITITASNNQETGYVAGSNKTASTTISLSASGNTVTASDGTNKISKSVTTVAQATPSVSVDENGKITATATQTAGYVVDGSKSATKQLAFQPAKIITPTTASQIAVSSGYYTGGDITVNGDSNLVAGNIKSGVSIFGVSGTYEGSGGGDTSVEDGLIAGAISTYTNSRATIIGSYKFANCTSLLSVNFQNVKTINMFAFSYCYKLASVSFPNAIYIDNGAFFMCSSLTTANFPEVTFIMSSAFQCCKNLTTASFPKTTNIDGYAFYDCPSLTTVSFPAATSIGSRAFALCYSLTTVSFPAATNIGSYALFRCCNLKSLYLTGSSLCKLSNSNAFSSTPIGGYSASAGTYGSIYIPASLLASYQTATNWAYFSSRFVGI